MPQDKRPLGLTKPKKVPAKRVREIADSLMNESNMKKASAAQNERIAKSQLKYRGKSIDSLIKSPEWGSIYKKNVGKGQFAIADGKLGNAPNQPTPEQRLEKAKMLRQSASADSVKSVRFQNLIKKK